MFRKKTGKALVAGGIPRVSLLPHREVEERARRVLWTRWLRASYWAFLSVALEAAIAFAWTVQADNELTTARQASVQLQEQLSEHSEVINLRTDVGILENLRERAGSNDQEWGPLIAEIKSVLPPGVELIGFKLAPGAAPKPGIDPSAQVGLKGTFTFSAKTTSAQAETITKLRTVSTFIDVDAGELTSDGPGGGFTFVTTFSADQTRYTGRFVQDGVK
jgi:hypothetical protein